MDEMIFNQIGFTSEFIDVVKNANNYECIDIVEMHEVKEVQIATTTSSTEYIYNENKFDGK